MPRSQHGIPGWDLEAGETLAAPSPLRQELVVQNDLMDCVQRLEARHGRVIELYGRVYRGNSECPGGMGEFVKFVWNVIFFHGRADDVPRAPSGIQKIVLRRGYEKDGFRIHFIFGLNV